MTIWIIIPSLCAATFGFTLWKRRRIAARERLIRAFRPPPRLLDELRKRHPQLSLEDCMLVCAGLRQFFLCYLKSGFGYVSMPSQVVDDLWHALILDTREYRRFCQRAFGRFLHHRPAWALSGKARQADAGLRRCWWYACEQERIDPHTPGRVPLLFDLDRRLGIAGGFLYVADCRGVRRDDRGDSGSTVIYCGGDFVGSDSSYDSSDFGDGRGVSDSSSGSGDSWGGDSGGGDSGGDSGGCGGGCGGGGD